MEFYDLSITLYDNKIIKLLKFKNKIVIVVNVASNCGLSEESYKKLKLIKEKFKNEIILILCPCDQFNKQEFENIEETENFIKEKLEIKTKLEENEIYLTKAIKVKGNEIDPLFNFLINKKNGWFGNNIKWNFSSFLINKNGEVLERYSPMSFITIEKIEKHFK